MGRYVKGTNVVGDSIKGSSNVAMLIPAGTTAERPTTGVAGQLRLNTTSNKLEFHNGTAFVNVTGGVSGVATITADTYTGDGTTTVFGGGVAGGDSTVEAPLSFTPSADQNVLVFIDGVFQPDTSYSVSGVARTFGSAPGGGTKIVVLHGFDTV